MLLGTVIVYMCVWITLSRYSRKRLHSSHYTYIRNRYLVLKKEEKKDNLENVYFHLKHDVIYCETVSLKHENPFSKYDIKY